MGLVRVFGLWSCLFLMGCTHLLYPAERLPFYDRLLLKPIPQEIYIPVFNEQHNSLLHAWYFPSRSLLKKNRLIVHFHGNGQNLTTHFMFFRWLIDYGYDYLIFDYRGYGASSDDKATQQKTVEDGQAVFKYVSENFKNFQVIAIGQSLGSNVLVRTLQELNEKKRHKYLPQLIILDSAFFSYKSATSSVLSQRWFTYPLKPLSYIAISDEWSAEEKIELTPPLPALFFHGTNDIVIKYEIGEKAFAQWPGPKVMTTLADGEHTSAFRDRRFNKNFPLLLTCMDQVFKPNEIFEDCVK